MAIAHLQHVTLVGHTTDKDRILEVLQSMGCMHLVLSRAMPPSDPPAGPSPAARRALRFLQDAPRQRRQVTDPTVFDAVAVRDRTLATEHRLLDLNDERDSLLHRIEGLSRWGDFVLPPLEELAGQRLWFYVVPHHLLRKVASLDLVWSAVRQDTRHAYVVVVSPAEPVGLPVERTHTGARSLAALERRLEQVEVAIEDAEAERAGLTRWRDQLAGAIDRLDDLTARAQAGLCAVELAPLFGLSGFVPSSRLATLQRYAAQQGLCLRARQPTEDDAPPTLLENPPALEPGEALVTFYTTPGYFTWDPSATVLFSFALFFAMILADAGYALLLGLGLAFRWRGLGRQPVSSRLRRVAAVAVASALAYGMLVGSYFGVEPPTGTVLANLRLLDARDAATLMPLSIGLGGLHLLLANVIEAWRLAPSREALAPLGWATALLGALGWGTSSAGLIGSDTLEFSGQVAVVAGMLAVLFFAAPASTPTRRLLAGAAALTRVSALFGDVLSYLRLFALGLASCSLAIAFNDLAASVRVALGPPGMVAGLLLLLVGHTLNLLLSVIGGVVHGLRLNAIEFFNWSLREEGKPFVPFRRKEHMRCNP